MYSSIIYKISKQQINNIYNRSITSNLLRKPLIIKRKEDLYKAKLYVGVLPFFTFKDNSDYEGIKMLSFEDLSYIMLDFDLLEKRKEEEYLEVKNNIKRRHTYFKPRDLNEGYLVVYRDRENPNNIGRIEMINNLPHINNIEFDNQHPLIKDVRIVENGRKPEEYFQSDETGFNRYMIEQPELKDKPITKTMNLFF